MKKQLLFVFAMMLAVVGLHAQTACTAPTGLKATAHSPEWRNVYLNWNPVVDPSQQIINWSSTGTGHANSGSDFIAAIRFATSDLTAHNGKALTAVQFRPGMSSSECTYTIKVWMGSTLNTSDNTYTEGTLVCSQVVSQNLELGALNTIPLETPITIDPTQELVIGIQCVHSISGFPMGYCTDAVISYKSGLTYTSASGWHELVLSGTQRGWHICGVLTNTNNIVAGYNVYRDNNLLTTTHNNYYVDTLYSDGTAYYDITASYANGCESSATSDSVVMNNDCYISSFPYTETFDNVSGTTASTLVAHVLPNCWSYINKGASYPGYPVVYNGSSYANSGVNSLRFYVYNTSGDNTTYADQYAILPPIDITTNPINSLQMEFDARCWATTSTYQLFLEVGVMSALSDVSTFVPVDTINCTGTSYGNYVVNFSHYTGNGQYIALRAPKIFTGGTVYNSGAVDNILLDIIPTCPKPTDLTINQSTITSNSLDLSWTENGSANEWVVEYGPAGFMLGTGTSVVATATSMTISGLSAATPYEFYVRSVCSAGDTSSYSSSVLSSTSCGMITSLPYRQDFEAYPGSTSGTSNNFGSSCWTNISTGTISSYAGYPIIYSTSTYAQSGSNCVRFYTYTTSTYGDEYAILPAIDVSVLPMNTLQMEFSASKYSSYSLTLYVGVMSNPTDVNSFVPVDTIVVPTTATAYEYANYIVSFENYTGNGNYIAFKAPQPTTSYNAGYLDDVVVSLIPNCKKPTDVRIANLTHNSASIEWTSIGDETAWDVILVPAGNALTTGTIENVYSLPYEIYNLDPSTNYEVYVRSNCGAEVSEWTNALYFTTRCAPITTIPYTEDFDSYAAATAVSSGTIPTCWQGVTNYTSNYPYIYASQHASGTGSLYFYSTTAYYSKAISPAIDITTYNADELMLSFKALKTGASYGVLNVYATTNPMDESSYTLLKSLASTDYPAAGTWYEQNVVLNTQYTEPVFFIFEAPVTSTNYVCIDDITVTTVPECSSPRNAFISNVNGISAKVTWDEAFFGADGYYVDYAEAGTQNWSTPEYVSGTNFTLTGLDPMTAYEARVSSNCATGYAEPIIKPFHTTCLITENQAVGAGTTSNTYVPFYTAYMSSYSQQMYTAAEMGNAPKDISTISFQYSGSANISRNLKIYLLNTMAANVSSWVPMDNAQLVFYGDVNFFNGAGSDGWNTIVLDSTFHYDGISNLVIAVDNFSSETLGTTTTDKTFKAHSATNMARYVYSSSTTAPVDYDPFNMTVTGTSSSTRNNILFGSCNTSTTCAAPTITNIEATDNQITIEWIQGYQENSWELEYKEAAASNWINEGVISDMTYTLSNVNSNTEYNVRVRALCTDVSEWATTTVKTFCVPINVPYTEDFETADGSGAGHMVDCWTRGTSSSTAYPYTYSTYSHSGSYSLYFYGTSAYYSYAATPRFDDSVQMDSLQIRFWARKTSAAYNIHVGLMTNPYDYSTFEELATITPDTISTWQEFEISTSGYTGNARFVAFRIPTAITSYMAVDDILIQYIPDCQRVSDITASNIQTHQADITWTPGGSESTWYYVYGLKDSVDIENASPIMTASNTITLTDLVENSDYDIYVQSVCDNGVISEALKYTFHTACDVVSSLPFIEYFDTYGTGSTVYMNCWSKINTYSADRPYISTTTFSAPGALYFYAGTAGTYNIAITPRFADDININNLQVSFKYRTTYATDRMIVGVLTDNTNAATFVPVDTVSCSSTSSWEDAVVSLASYTGNGRYIGFKAEYNTTYCYGYIDNLIIETLPACDAPTDLAASNISQTSVTLSWTPGDSETSWEVSVAPDGTSNSEIEPIIVNNDNNVTIANLTAGTPYVAYIRAICPGNTGFSTYVTTSFTTACNPETTLPFSENFDAYTGVTTGTVNNLPACWDYLNLGGTSASYVGYPVIYSTSSYSQSTPNSIRFYTGTAAAYGDQYCILPEIDNTTYPLNTLQLAFDARKYSTSYASFDLIIGVITDIAADTSFVPLDTLSITSLDYEHFVTYLNNYNGTGRICLKAAKNTANSINAGNLDNIVVSLAPNCFRVTDLSVATITNNSVSLSWTPSGSETNWNVSYKISADTTWYYESVSTPYATINNLQANTTYDFRVQSDCGSEVSEYSNILTVSTDCELLTTLPYFTNFDDLSAGTSSTENTLPNCWHYLNNGTTYLGYPTVYNSSSYSNSGTNSLRFYSYTSTIYGDQFAILPGIDTSVNPINTLQLQFGIRKYSTSYATFTCYVGLMTNPLDETTFVPFDTVVVSETSYSTHTTYFGNYTGYGNYIAIKSPKASMAGVTYNAGDIDDLEISVAPTCLPVSSITANNISSTSIEIEWTPNGTESQWNISYRPENDTTWIYDFVSGTPSFTASNLQSNTAYAFRVQADCGGSDFAPYSPAFIFRTECSEITTLPFSENFDGMVGSTSGTSNNLPDCWDHLSGTNSSYVGYPIVYSTTTYAQSQPNSLRFYTYNGTSDYGDQYAILPAIDASINPINTLQIAFGARKNSTSSTYNFMLVIGVMNDASDASSFEAVDTVRVVDVTYSTFTVNLNAYNGIGNRIAIKAPRISENTYNTGYVDNIVVSIAPIVCNTPTDLTVSNITTDAATATWNAGNATAWNVQYKDATAADWSNPQPVTTPSFTMSNLTPGSSYQVRVQADCGDGTTSSWTDAVSFTTLTPTTCDDPANVTASNITTNSATITWVGGNASAWNIQYKEASATNWGNSIPVTTNSYALTNLNANTQYDVRVQADCGNGDVSNWISTTFTTLDNSCPAPYNLHTVDLTFTSATLSWSQEAGTANSWTIQYRAQGTTAWTEVPASFNTMTLSNLDNGTTYEAQVIAHCINGFDSDPSNLISFFTPIDTTGIEDYTLANSINIFPNPTTGTVQVQSSKFKVQNISVYDVYGKLLKAEAITDFNNIIDLSGYAAGVYFLRISTENGVATKRIVKK